MVKKIKIKVIFVAVASLNGKTTKGKINNIRVWTSKEDQEYFLKISGFIENLIGKKPVITIRNHKLGKSLKLVVYNKKFAEHLINDVGITCHNKTFEGANSNKYRD